MKTSESLNVAVVGAGLIGTKRARSVHEEKRTQLKIIVDSDLPKARALAKEFQCDSSNDWKSMLDDSGIGAVVVSTPNHLLCEIGCAALEAGKHVLIEKPMCRNLSEAKKIFRVARKKKWKLKVGFNHRYHPAIFRAHEIVKEGEIGDVINLRAQYGHGGRAGYEKEWRGNPKLAGGGELTDQGVHLIDLIQWFCGAPKEAFAYLQTAFWPIEPSEDNGFALLKYKNGVVANFHSSWTQWKNFFNFEVYGTKGYLIVNGLGGSYGAETLTVGTKSQPGQVPDIKTQIFDGPDSSWQREWDDFVSCLMGEKDDFLGNADEGLQVMKTLDALYQSGKLRKPISIK